MTSIDYRFEPNPEAQRVYDAVFEAYVGLYPAISPVLRGRLPAHGAARAGVAA
jgi:hypothetical protein